MAIVYESVTIHATKPLNSKFRYKNSFQIYPSKRKSKKYYPIILQLAFSYTPPYYRYSSNSSDILTVNTMEKLHLLSLFTQFHFFYFSKRKNPIKKFDATLFPKIKRGQINQYQDKTLDDRNVSEIIAPDNIEVWLEIYDELNDTKKNIFRKSLYLFYSGVELKATHPSQSFISFVSAIETLINFENYSPKKCSECNQFIYKISKRFKDFIWKYAYNNSKTETNKKFIDQLYSKRSDITPQGKLLVADLFWDNKQNFVDWGESFLHNGLIEITRICLINWLVKNNDNP